MFVAHCCTSKNTATIEMATRSQRIIHDVYMMSTSILDIYVLQDGAAVSSSPFLALWQAYIDRTATICRTKLQACLGNSSFCSSSLEASHTNTLLGSTCRAWAGLFPTASQSSHWNGHTLWDGNSVVLCSQAFGSKNLLLFSLIYKSASDRDLA